MFRKEVVRREESPNRSGRLLLLFWFDSFIFNVDVAVGTNVDVAICVDVGTINVDFDIDVIVGGFVIGGGISTIDIFLLSERMNEPKANESAIPGVKEVDRRRIHP